MKALLRLCEGSIKVPQGFVKALLRPLRHSRPRAVEHAGGSSAGELTRNARRARACETRQRLNTTRALIQLEP